MITFFDLHTILDLKCELEVRDWWTDILLQEGVNGSTDWNDDLLGRRVRKICPGIVTLVFLDVKVD